MRVSLFLVRISVVFFIALLVADESSLSQHAPATIQQCQADLTYWRQDVELSGQQYDDLLKQADELSLSDLTKLYNEAIFCIQIDRRQNVFANYLNWEILLSTNEHKRLMDFIKRHNLGSQFLSEDAAGLR